MSSSRPYKFICSEAHTGLHMVMSRLVFVALCLLLCLELCPVPWYLAGLNEEAFLRKAWLEAKVQADPTFHQALYNLRGIKEEIKEEENSPSPVRSSSEIGVQEQSPLLDTT
jgi:hypothetical protein